MTRNQARALISIAISVSINVTGTYIVVKAFGINWGLIGFIGSAIVSFISVYAFTVLSMLYDDLRRRRKG